MTRSRIMFVLAALALAAPAHAQRWGGSPVRENGRAGTTAEHRSAQALAGSGTVSQWGGSPVERRGQVHNRVLYGYPADLYFPDAVAAPEPVPAPVVHDTVYTVLQQAPVEMRVVTPPRDQAAPTTMDVYRQQARFRKQP